MNGNVTKEGITADLEAMKRVGIRGATIVTLDLDKVALLPPGPVRYASPEWLDLVDFAAKEADRLGIDLGVENIAGWSSSGGPWVTPEHSMQKVVASETHANGPGTYSEKLPQPVMLENFYRDIAVLAYPASGLDAGQGASGSAERNSKSPKEGVIHSDKIIDLTKSMDSTGTLTWNIPPGKWTILRLGYTTMNRKNHPGPPEGTGLECDKLSREAVKSYWDGIFPKVTRSVGPLLGKSFTHTLIDSYEVGTPDWSPAFREEFLKRRGYDMLRFLPVVTGKSLEGKAKPGA